MLPVRFSVLHNKRIHSYLGSSRLRPVGAGQPHEAGLADGAGVPGVSCRSSLARLVELHLLHVRAWERVQPERTASTIDVSAQKICKFCSQRPRNATRCTGRQPQKDFLLAPENLDPCGRLAESCTPRVQHRPRKKMDCSEGWSAAKAKLLPSRFHHEGRAHEGRVRG